jgi:hypothetical protein
VSACTSNSLYLSIVSASLLQRLGFPPSVLPPRALTLSFALPAERRGLTVQIRLTVAALPPQYDLALGSVDVGALQ